jgi:hypothetical protein
MMRIFGVVLEGKDPFPLLKIQYLNLVDMCEVYLFRNEIFAIVKYVSFLIEDLLEHSIYLIEREIVYIISQVS